MPAGRKFPVDRQFLLDLLLSTIWKLPSNQDLDSDGFTGTPPINNGQASFSITGSTKEGQLLNINKSSPDPDGDDGNYSYQWQASADGKSWSDVPMQILLPTQS